MKTILILLALSTPGLADNLWGKWVTECIKQDNYYYKGKLLLETGTYTFTGLMYTDAECTKAGARLDAVGAFMSDQDLVGDVDISFQSVDLTPVEAGVASGMNLFKVCGLKSWKVGVAQSVLGKNCFGQRVPGPGEFRYNIYAFASRESLLLGRITKEQDGTSPSTRPTELADEYPLHRIRVLGTH